MQACGVVIDLHFVEHVDMRLTGQLRSGDLVEWLVDVITRLLAEKAYLARDATYICEIIFATLFLEEPADC